MQYLSRFNGNGHRYKTELPELFILQDNINDVALENIKKNTGIDFKKVNWGYSGKPKTCYQISKLLVTYDFKTQYHNNNTNRNILFLKFCSEENFNVKTICFNCCKDNNISTKDLPENYKLIV